jgi:hypothetical protein
MSVEGKALQGERDRTKASSTTTYIKGSSKAPPPITPQGCASALLHSLLPLTPGGVQLSPQQSGLTDLVGGV